MKKKKRTKSNEKRGNNGVFTSEMQEKEPHDEIILYHTSRAVICCINPEFLLSRIFSEFEKNPENFFSLASGNELRFKCPVCNKRWVKMNYLLSQLALFIKKRSHKDVHLLTLESEKNIIDSKPNLLPSKLSYKLEVNYLEALEYSKQTEELDKFMIKTVEIFNKLSSLFEEQIVKLLSNKHVITSCPSEYCSSPKVWKFVDKSKKGPEYCDGCNSIWCSSCILVHPEIKTYHDRFTCKEFLQKIDNESKIKETIEKITKNCPKCKIPIIHYWNHGCHEISCPPPCEHKFCYVCLNEKSWESASFCKCPIYCEGDKDSHWACDCPICPTCCKDKSCGDACDGCPSCRGDSEDQLREREQLIQTNIERRMIMDGWEGPQQYVP